jgi:tetratricopeptide (TPR) repeat protein
MKMFRHIVLSAFVTPILIIILTGCSREAERPKDNLQTAIETAEQIGTHDNYLTLSLRYYEAGQFEKCIEAAEKALEMQPDSAGAYNNICAAYNELELWDRGIEACTHALEIDPEFQLAKNNLEWARSSKAKQK